MKANTTASGSAPPASGEPNGMEAAIAAPGAIEHIDWNTTSRNPMASLANLFSEAVISLPCKVTVGGRFPAFFHNVIDIHERGTLLGATNLERISLRSLTKRVVHTSKGQSVRYQVLGCLNYDTKIRVNNVGNGRLRDLRE
jgi:hypothetical protein